MNDEIVSGSFRRRQGFTMASNVAIRDRGLSLRAKGLYTVIMSYITNPEIILTKDFLKKIGVEGKKAFEATWLELKNAGYLKVYMQPSPVTGAWTSQYDLLDEPVKDGAHSYYLDVNGTITGTNLTTKEKRDQKAKAVSGNHREERYPPKGIYAKGTYPKGIYPKGGNKIILNNNTNNNTGNNTLSNKCAEKSKFSESLKISTEDDSDGRGTPITPKNYNNNPLTTSNINYKEISIILNFISSWDFIQKNPFKTKKGNIDEEKMSAYKLCLDCITEMIAAKDVKNYRGVPVSSADVAEAVRVHSNNFSEGGLMEFMDEASNAIIEAYKSTDIVSIRNYAMAVIWSCFSTYKVKENADYYA